MLFFNRNDKKKKSVATLTVECDDVVRDLTSKIKQLEKENKSLNKENEELRNENHYTKIRNESLKRCLDANFTYKDLEEIFDRKITKFDQKFDAIHHIPTQYTGYMIAKREELVELFEIIYEAQKEKVLKNQHRHQDLVDSICDTYNIEPIELAKAIDEFYKKNDEP